MAVALDNAQCKERLNPFWTLKSILSTAACLVMPGDTSDSLPQACAAEEIRVVVHPVCSGTFPLRVRSSGVDSNAKKVKFHQVHLARHVLTVLFLKKVEDTFSAGLRFAVHCTRQGWETPVNILEVNGLTKYFGGVAALKDVSFAVGEKEICGFIGPNGAGKTTLFSLIAGAVKPSAGRIKLRGQDITGRNPAALVKKGLARTHQIVRPFRAMTVSENVRLAVHFGRARAKSARSAQEQALEVLRQVGLEEKAHLLAANLSLGDQKRLEVARALATGADLLLLDEICGGLNSTETAAILELIQRIRQGGATIMYVEHDMKAVMSVCDRITVLDFGQKLAEGRPEEIQSNEAVIKAYLGKPTLGSAPSAK